MLAAAGRRFGCTFAFREALFGGAAYDATGHPLPPETLELCKQSDAVLLGAIGGPKWDGLPVHLRLFPKRLDLEGGWINELTDLLEAYSNSFA